MSELDDELSGYMSEFFRKETARLFGVPPEALENSSTGNSAAVAYEFRPYIFREPAPIEFELEGPSPLSYIFRHSYGVWGGNNRAPYLAPKLWRRRIGKQAWRKPVLRYRYPVNDFILGASVV